MAPVLKTITRDKETHRARDIKPGEDVMSIYDEIHSKSTRFMFRDINKLGDFRGEANDEPPRDYFYTEADALEDQVLFPDEHEEHPSKVPFRELTNALHKFEHEGPSFDRFIFELDSDEELPRPESSEVQRLKEGGRPDDLSDEDDDDSIGTDDFDESDGVDNPEASFTADQREVMGLMTKWMLDTPPIHRTVQDNFEIYADREKSKSRSINLRLL